MAREATVRRRRGPAQPVAPAAPGAPAAQTPQQPDTQGALRQMLFRLVLMYLLYQYYWKKKTAASPDSDSDIVATSSNPSPPPAASLSGLLGMSPENAPAYYAHKLKGAWTPGQQFAFRVFATLDDHMTFRDAKDRSKDDAIWASDGIIFANLDDSYRAENVSIPVPVDVRDRNATWYAHVFVVRGNLWDVDVVSDDMIRNSVLYSRHDIVKWLTIDPKKKGKNLLGANVNDDSAEPSLKSSSDVESADNSKDDTDLSLVRESEKDVGEDEQVRYDQVWKPTMPILLVTGAGPIILGQLPAAAAEMYHVNVEKRLYYPPMHVNEFWMLRDTLRQMNETVKEVTIEMSFAPIGLYKWNMYRQFDSIWQKQVDFGAMQPEEPDELKRMFIETNPLLLGTTMVVSIAHSVLEMLAFKNDISHWKNIKSMEGVSVRTMIWKIVMEAIIFLYLWDNDTSWMITVGNGIGLGIAIWKLGKAVKFENFGKRKLFGFIPWLDMTDRASYSKETKEYDDQAMKYLGYALYPLVLMYALYSLRYEKHKSWYSWIINSLVGAVYAFGFIMMFPQIFINYKLKSVAHMPMKAMMYKTLNTIIDDLFSFIIKMPWLHRLACFRDDIVFLILLYQRYIYPVDNKRVNEFGQHFDEDGEEKAPLAATDGETATAGVSETNNEADGTNEEVKDSVEKKND